MFVALSEIILNARIEARMVNEIFFQDIYSLDIAYNTNCNY